MYAVKSNCKRGSKILIISPVVDIFYVLPGKHILIANTIISIFYIPLHQNAAYKIVYKGIKNYV